MRAWVVHQPGPVAGGPLRLTERAVPEPGPGELLIRVRCCGVCRTDLHLAEGDLPPKQPDLTPGHEVVGEVVTAGPGATRFAAGDRVGVAWLGADGSGPAVVTGPAAAYWHGMLDPPPRQIAITVPRRTHLRAPPGTVLLRRDLAAEDVRWVRDLRVAAPAFAALETAVVVGSTFLDRVLQRHVLFPDIYRCYCRNLGRRGSGSAAGLLAAAADRADSDAERRLVTLLHAAGISGWVLGHRLGPWTIDLAFPDARVAVEVDGWAWHVEVDRFRNDRRKGNAIVRAGWTLLRFTWHDLYTRPSEVIAEIREVVAAAA